MTVPPPPDYTPEQLSSPGTDAHTLAHAANTRPDLWNAILANPNCYPELSAWIRQQQGVQGGQPGAFPGKAEQQSTQGMHRPAQPQSSDSAGQQFAAGAKQMANGAKDFFNSKVAPAATSATARIAQNTAAPQGSTGSPGTAGTGSQGPASAVNWFRWSQIGTVALAVVGFISLFLPVATVRASFLGFGEQSQTTTWFEDEDSAGFAVTFIVLFILVIGLGIAALFVVNFWVRMASAVVSGLTALLGIVISLLLLVGIGQAGNSYGLASASASPGPGAILLLIVSLVLVVAAVFNFVSALRSRPTAPQPNGTQWVPPQARGEQEPSQQAAWSNEQPVNPVEHPTQYPAQYPTQHPVQPDVPSNWPNQQPSQDHQQPTQQQNQQNEQ